MLTFSLLPRDIAFSGPLKNSINRPCSAKAIPTNLLPKVGFGFYGVSGSFLILAMELTYGVVGCVAFRFTAAGCERFFFSDRTPRSSGRTVNRRNTSRFRVVVVNETHSTRNNMEAEATCSRQSFNKDFFHRGRRYRSFISIILAPVTIINQ